MFHHMLHKKLLFRGISIFLILFMLRDGMVGTGVFSTSPVENLNSHKLAALSFSGQLQLAAKGPEQGWIRAVRGAALEFAKSIKKPNYSSLDIRDQVSKFLKTIERNHNRHIPIQIATRASNFALMDEMETFLQREIEFAMAAKETDKVHIYRLALFELLITKFFNPFKGKPPLSIFNIVDVQKLIRTVILPSFSVEIYRGEHLPFELIPLWVDAYRSFLMARQEAFQQGGTADLDALINEVDRFQDKLERLIKLNNPLPASYPFLPNDDVIAQVVQIGLRYVIFGIHYGLGNVTDLINLFIRVQLKSIIEVFERDQGETYERLVQEVNFLFNRFLFPSRFVKRTKTKAIYKVYDKLLQRDLFVEVPNKQETLIESVLVNKRMRPIQPIRNNQLKTKGVLNQKGEIELNLDLHDNTLHLLSTWMHELFHLKWIYTLKSQPLVVQAWTQRILQHRETWEKIEEAFLQTYGKDPQMREEWLQSSPQRKVNEILALVYGYSVLHRISEGGLGDQLEQEYRILIGSFRFKHDLNLTERMVFELETLRPIEELFTSIPDFEALLEEIMSDPFNEIKKLDPTYTERDIPICDRMAYAEYLAEQRAKEKEELDEDDLKEIEETVNEMGEEIDALVEAMVEEADETDKIETDIDNDQAQHDIKDVTTQSVLKYIKSGKKNKSFEEALNAVAKNLQQKVFTNESVETVKDLLKKSEIKGKLKGIYDKAEGEYRESESAGGETNGLSTESKGHLAAFLHQLKHRLGLDHHHGKGQSHGLGPNSPMLLFFIFIGGALLAGTVLQGDPFAFFGENFYFMLGMVAPFGLLGQEETPEQIVEKYTTNLTEMAKEGKFEDSGYLEVEARKIANQAGVSGANNTILVGDPIVGEALVEAMATRIAQGTSKPKNLTDVTFLEFNTTRFIDELSIPGKFEDEIRRLILAIKATKKTDKVVLVLNFQDIYRVGALTLKGRAMANLYFRFKEAITDPDISILGVANEKVYKEYFEGNEDLKRSFGVVEIKTPPKYNLIRILRDFKRRIPDIYKDLLPEGIRFKVMKKTLDGAIELCRKYDPSGSLPNKVQEILDRIIVEKLGRTRDLELQLKDIEERLNRGVKELVRAEEAGDEKTTTILNVILMRLLEEKDSLLKQQEEHNTFLTKVKEEKKWEITLEDIAIQISKETGIPIYELQEDEKEKLAKYPEEMKKRVIGQDHVVDETYNALTIRSEEMGEEGKPIGAFIFVGPTGVGKTEVARSMGRQLFGSEEAMIRIDMSEYMLKNAKDRLIGAPPGYVGYDQGGYLTNKVQERV